MYRGRYYKQTPPGYSGVAFASGEAAEAETRKEDPPTPVGSGAGVMARGIGGSQASNTVENNGQNARHTRPPLSEVTEDTRNQIRTLPRDFSGTSGEESGTSGNSFKNFSGDLSGEGDGQREMPLTQQAFSKSEPIETVRSKPYSEAKAKIKGETLGEVIGSLFKTPFTLEELLLVGVALLLTTKEEGDEALPILGLALMLLGGK